MPQWLDGPPITIYHHSASEISSSVGYIEKTINENTTYLPLLSFNLRLDRFSGRFVSFHQPLVLYNSEIRSIIRNDLTIIL